MGSTLHVITVFDPGILEYNTHDDDTLTGIDGWFPLEYIQEKFPTL